MEASITLPFVFSAIGAVAGLLVQQAIEIWKTLSTHRQELQRRFFDQKLQAAIDLAKALDALVSAYQARLAEAVERTRGDENFSFLQVSRDVLDLETKALERDYDRYVAAFALLELRFSPNVVAATQNDTIAELGAIWREFDEAWLHLVDTLNKLLPDKRMQEFREQRERGHFEEWAHGEMAIWMSVYEAENTKIRSYLPRIAQLTLRAEEHRRSVLQALAKEMKPYQV